MAFATYLRILTQLQAIDDQAYQQRINTFVQGFVDEQALPAHKREDIRAIVVTGDASAAAVGELGDAALKSVGNEKVRLLTDFASSQVIAQGAAVFAGAIHENPHYFVEPSRTSKYFEKQWAEFVAQLEKDERERRENSEL